MLTGQRSYTLLAQRHRRTHAPQVQKHTSFDGSVYRSYYDLRDGTAGTDGLFCVALLLGTSGFGDVGTGLRML